MPSIKYRGELEEFVENLTEDERTTLLCVLSQKTYIPTWYDKELLESHFKTTFSDSEWQDLLFELNNSDYCSESDLHFVDETLRKIRKN